MQRRRAVSQRSPTPHPELHRPPQPSSSPHALSGVQRLVHAHENNTGSQVAKGLGQGPTQRPPQPSSVPQGVSAWQSRSHWQRPTTQRSRGERVHGGSQPQVGTQRPSTQSAPAGHVTRAQGLGTQRPSAHTSSAPHATPSQAERGVQRTWQVNPSAQRPGHGVTRVQRPVVSSQN